MYYPAHAIPPPLPCPSGFLVPPPLTGISFQGFFFGVKTAFFWHAPHFLLLHHHIFSNNPLLPLTVCHNPPCTNPFGAPTPPHHFQSHPPKKTETRITPCCTKPKITQNMNAALHIVHITLVCNKCFPRFFTLFERLSKSRAASCFRASVASKGSFPLVGCVDRWKN